MVGERENEKRNRPRVNGYYCKGCSQTFFSVDVDVGITPGIVKCVLCNYPQAESLNYQVPARRLNDAVIEFTDPGGMLPPLDPVTGLPILEMRERTDAVPFNHGQYLDEIKNAKAVSGPVSDPDGTGQDIPDGEPEDPEPESGTEPAGDPGAGEKTDGRV